ncbi:MAG: hypothetical protein LBI28_03185 [Treponema sp.]|jgi:hypothetical protein|nr:hypothetical protein [Treponema sp.]
MYNLDTKEEVDLDRFMEALENNEIQIVSKEWTEEEKAELSREIAKRRAMQKEALASKAVLA